jgi:threonine dehydratase
MNAKKPSAKIFGAEPATAAKLEASMKAGKLTSVQDPHSIADGLIPPSMGDLTFEACSKYVDGVFTVSDEEILAAMKLIIKEARIFPEPSGAAGIAALLAGRDTERLGKRIVFVISGGNVSQKLLGQILTS